MPKKLKKQIKVKIIFEHREISKSCKKGKCKLLKRDTKIPIKIPSHQSGYPKYQDEYQAIKSNLY